MCTIDRTKPNIQNRIADWIKNLDAVYSNFVLKTVINRLVACFALSALKTGGKRFTFPIWRLYWRFRGSSKSRGDRSIFSETNVLLRHDVDEKKNLKTVSLKTGKRYKHFYKKSRHLVKVNRSRHRRPYKEGSRLRHMHTGILVTARVLRVSRNEFLGGKLPVDVPLLCN